MLNVSESGHYQSPLTENALSILEKRYFLKDDDGNVIENWEGLCRRVSHYVASAHIEDTKDQLLNRRDKYFDMMYNLDFLPNTPTLVNAGKGTKQSLSACFVCPIENDVRQILDTIRNTVLIHKAGGGTGFNFSKVDHPNHYSVNSKKIDVYFQLDDNHVDYEEFFNNHFYINSKVICHVTGKNMSDILSKHDRNKEEFIIINIKDDLSNIFDFKAIYNIISDIKLSNRKYTLVLNFSNIRPKGSFISTSKGEASGPVSFMRAWEAFFNFISNEITPISTIKFFDSCTEAVKQGGVRRGANMGILNIHNPYIKEFIHCKENENAINNFNLSVGITDNELFLENEYGYEDLLDEISICAWKNGEPGLVFLDKINEKRTTEEEIEATNPCGEQPLLPYESCNLGSINLANMVHIDENGVRSFDWTKFKETVHTAVEFLDDVIDVNDYPIPEIEEATKKYRKIGLGVMGFADMLCLLGIPYDDSRAIEFAEDISRNLQREANSASLVRGRLYGKCPACNTITDPFHSKRNAALTTIAPTGSLSTIAGCSSGIEPLFSVVYARKVVGLDKEILCVNPIFKHIMEERHPIYIEQPNLMDDLIQYIYTDGFKNVIGDDFIIDLFKPSEDIDYTNHIEMQAAWQRFIDNAISKTIIMSEDAYVYDVCEAYVLAYEKDCKGITIYRNNSRSEQVLSTGSKKTSDQLPEEEENKLDLEEIESVDIEDTDEEMNEFEQNHYDFEKTMTEINDNLKTILHNEYKENVGVYPNQVEYVTYQPKEDVRTRPECLSGYTQKIKIGCGVLYVTTNFDDEGIREVFATTGKSGGCISQSEATCRMISNSLKNRIPVEEIIKQLKGIRCSSAIKNSSGSSLSCPDAIARCIEKCIKRKQEEDGKQNNKNVIDNIDKTSLYPVQPIHVEFSKESIKNFHKNIKNVFDEDLTKCPDCGSDLELEGGCVVCRSCGWSKCH